MLSKVLLGALASVILIPVSAVAAAVLLAGLVAVLWMSGVHALIRRAELGRRDDLPAGVSERRVAAAAPGMVNPGGSRSPS